MPANPLPVNKLFSSCVFFRKETPIRTNLENYKQTVSEPENKHRRVFCCILLYSFLERARGDSSFLGKLKKIL
jgi:hypothetical protein